MSNDKKHARTLALLGRRWVTALDSAQNGGVLSLSQRVSCWRSAGMVILDKWIVTDSGARIKAYKLLKPTKWTA